MAVSSGGMARSTFTFSSRIDSLSVRTGGSIASLSDLIIDAATDAIDFGTEAITLDLLDSIAIDDVDPGVAR